MTTCETCRFWKFLKEQPPENYGLCRKHAPVRIAGEGDGWPGTFHYDGCSEYQPRAAAPALDANADALLTAKVMRACADRPAASGLVPITPTTLRDWADLIDALAATRPGPRRTEAAMSEHHLSYDVSRCFMENGCPRKGRCLRHLAPSGGRRQSYTAFPGGEDCYGFIPAGGGDD